MLWAKYGDQERLLEAFKAIPAWVETGWLARAFVLASRGSLQEACELIGRYVETPALPTFTLQKPVAELRRNLMLTTNDFVTGFALYRAHEEASETNEALDTVRKLTTAPNCPKYFFYLQAKLAMKTGGWEEAWRAWNKFLGV